MLLKGDEESLPQLNPPIVRIALLYFLREVFKCGRQQALLRRIVMSLFAVSDSVELRKAQMLGSPAFCVKLRYVCVFILLLTFSETRGGWTENSCPVQMLAKSLRLGAFFK